MSQASREGLVHSMLSSVFPSCGPHPILEEVGAAAVCCSVPEELDLIPPSTGGPGFEARPPEVG